MDQGEPCPGYFLEFTSSIISTNEKKLQYDKGRIIKASHPYRMKVWVNPSDTELQSNEILVEGQDTLNGDEKKTSCLATKLVELLCIFCVIQFCLFVILYKEC